MINRVPPRLRAVIIAALAAVAVTVSVTVVVDDEGTPKVTVTAQTKQGPITAPAPAVQAAKENTETGLGHETQTPRDELHNDQVASPKAPRIAGPVPLASVNQRGCTTRQNTHNFSYRNGTRPSIIPLHLTVAANRPGWGDVNGVAIFLNRPATQASANYIIDAEGHCLYTVPESLKAWTQANLNPASACSFEVQNTGSEATYAGAAGLAKLALVVHDCAKRWHIPLQRASVSGSRVIRPGVIDHLHLGPAGGNHSDIRRFGEGCRLYPGLPANAPTWRCVDLVIAKARALDPPAVSAAARRQCQELNRLRKIERRTPEQGARAQLLKRTLERRYVCSAGKHGKPGSIRRR